MVFSVTTYLTDEGAKSKLFYCRLTRLQIGFFRGYSLCNMSKYVDFSVPGLQSGFPALGVRIKIRILAVFFNQRYESGPKATVSTCPQVGLVMLSGELSDSVDSHPLCFDSLLEVLG